MSSTPSGSRLDLVHRIGAAVLGGGLCVFGVLGVADRLEFLAVRGKVVLGLATNGLLATISLIVGGVLIGAALRGGRSSSTITVVVGALFLLSGLLNLAVLDTPLNLLAFRLSNVIFSFVAGMMLLFLGAYGRFSGGLSADNPYYQQRHRNDPPPTPEHTAHQHSDIDEAELAGSKTPGAGPTRRTYTLGSLTSASVPARRMPPYLPTGRARPTRPGPRAGNPNNVVGSTDSPAWPQESCEAATNQLTPQRCGRAGRRSAR